MKRFPQLVLSFVSALLVFSALSRSAQAQTFPGKIAFYSTRTQNGLPQIFLMNGDGSNQINLSNNGFDDEMPVFNRLGTKILYLSEHPDLPGFQLCTMNADGTDQKIVVSDVQTGVQLLNYGFSPDGSKILYAGYVQPQNTAQVYTMNADGSGITPLGPGYDGVYSPDGTKIVFIRIDPPVANPSNQFEFDLVEMNPDGTGQTILVYNVYPCPPSFSPDGSKIAYATYTPGGNSDTDISVMNADGTGQRVIATGGYETASKAAYNLNPTFSPDGTQVAFESNRSVPPPGVFEDDEIWSVNVDGTNLTQLTFYTVLNPGISWNRSPSWGPGAIGFPALIGLALNPTSVISGNSSQGTVTLSGPAPSGGAVVALSSASPNAIVPADVTIAEGATSASFPIATTTVSVTTQAAIVAAYAGTSQSASLTLIPPDRVAITRAEYTISQKQLRLETISTSLNATLKAYVTATGALIGTLTNVGGGKYQLQTTWPTNPQNVTVKSSLGGSASSAVTPHN